MKKIRTFKNYEEMKQQHQKDVSNLNLGFAFSDKQFDEMMAKWGLDSKNDLDKIVKLPLGGGFLRKCDVENYYETFERFDQEEKLFKKTLKN